jgi:hypothetical protein
VEALHEIKNIKQYLNEYKGNIKIDPPNNPEKSLKKTNIDGYFNFKTEDGKFDICLEKDKSLKGFKLYYIKKLNNY